MIKSFCLIETVGSLKNLRILKLTCSSDSVNVSVDISSDVKIDDRSNVRDVQTSSCDVGGDQYRKFFLLERVDDLVTFDLEETG